MISQINYGGEFKKEIFDYDQAMSVIGDDKEFLIEIINDIILEIQENEEKFIQFKRKEIHFFSDYGELWEIGYTVRASTSYLVCNEMSRLAKEIKVFTQPFRNLNIEVSEEEKRENQRRIDDFYDRFWLAKVRLFEEFKKHRIY